MFLKNKIFDIAVVGLGYVGLPLAIEFSKKRTVIGFDVDKDRIKSLKLGIDINYEFKKKDLKNSKNLIFTYKKKDIKHSNCFIVTVPTPINKYKKPDLNNLISATKMIGSILKNQDLVIYESTVYPGCIEEICVPLLEKISKLKFNHNFFCGYSPERINPGDKNHTISNIKKITSGSNSVIADIVDNLYKEIIKAGTHKAPSIKVAEAAKVIENTQRDLNIALINEFSIIFNKMKIDSSAVLKAAESKWNFLSFKPGLVGGHCIGVDPYYLTYKSIKTGYIPKVILAGRNINDNMGKYVATELIKKMKIKKISVNDSKILIMGLTFKENCADTRNSGVEKIISELKKFKCNIYLQDPYVKKYKKYKNSNIKLTLNLKKNYYDAIIIAVAHDDYKKMQFNFIKSLCKKNNVIFDLKNIYNSDMIDFRL